MGSSLGKVIPVEINAALGSRIPMYGFSLLTSKSCINEDHVSGFSDYPCPLVSFRNRKPVFEEVGHTVMNLLCDFRNFQYHLPFVENADCCMEKGVITMRIPRYRYDQVQLPEFGLKILYACQIFRMSFDQHFLPSRSLKFVSPPMNTFFPSVSASPHELMLIWYASRTSRMANMRHRPSTFMTRAGR